MSDGAAGASYDDNLVVQINLHILLSRLMNWVRDPDFFMKIV